MSKTILQGSIEGKRILCRPTMQWQDNIVKWTGIDINKAMRAAENREGWKQMLTKYTASKCYGIGKRLKKILL